ARRPVLASSESGQYVELPSDTRAVAAEIPVEAWQAWPRLVEVYGELGLPVATIQSAELRIGNPNFVIRNQIAGLRAARAFDCGRGRGGALVAELYPIHVSLHTRLIPSEAGGGGAGGVGAGRNRPRRGGEQHEPAALQQHGRAGEDHRGAAAGAPRRLRRASPPAP